MSIFAGVYSLDQGSEGPVPAQPCIDEILRSISRCNDRTQTWQGDRFFLAKVDVGAFPEPAFTHAGDGVITTVSAAAGHPFLLSSREPSVSRAQQLNTISAEFDAGHTKVCRDTDGVFALCYYRLPEGRLLLSTDRIGCRPLYYYVGKDYLYFSTALRVLESLSAVPKRMDIQGTAERMAFGFPLGDRTCYADIRILENGQYLLGENGTITLHSYFDWNEIGPTTLTLDQLLDAAYDTFRAGVARQSAGHSTVVANLSGGLDSRCIVTALHDLKKEVYAATWVQPGFVDAELAREYATVLGLKQAFRRLPKVPSWDNVFSCLADREWPDCDPPPRPNLVFSGDGGSVGVGFDYVEAEPVDWMRSGKKDRVIAHLVSRHALPRRFMRTKAYRDFHAAIVDGLKAEFGSIASHDPARDLHLFYMKNDQRRHLHLLYENIDRCRVEFLVPFYGGQFTELLGSGPVDEFLRHAFYHKWLDRFPPIIKAVAWQTYPGHLPCPVKTPVEGRLQWEKRRGDAFGGKHRDAFRKSATVLWSKAFPSVYFSRSRLCAAVLLHLLRLRCYNHVFGAFNGLYEVYSACQETEGVS